MKTLILATTFLSFTLASEIKITNNCPFTVWPGLQGNLGYSNPANGGFELGVYKNRTVTVENTWAGRIWASTNCDESGNCQTGDCNGKIECAGDGPIPPTSLAEFRLKGKGGLDYYYISLINGYNLPLKIQLTGGYVLRDDSKYDCKATGCIADLNTFCLDVLAVKGENGATVACKSACLAFNKDEYCCRDYYNDPGICIGNTWPVNYSGNFKQACPSAYTYTYDPDSPTFTCKGYPIANYEVVFCPSY